MATLLDFSLYQAVERDGLPRVAAYDDAAQRVLYRNGGAVVQSMETDAWLSTRGPLPVDPTPQQSADAIAAIEAARLAAVTAAAALRQAIINKAQSAVGVQIDLITAAQRNALLALLFW